MDDTLSLADALIVAAIQDATLLRLARRLDRIEAMLRQLDELDAASQTTKTPPPP